MPQKHPATDENFSPAPFALPTRGSTQILESFRSGIAETLQDLAPSTRG
jgi:hypothetical protein